MKFDRKLIGTITLPVAGILLVILANGHPVLIVVSIVILFIALFMNEKWHNIRWLHVVLIIIIWLLIMGFINNILFVYPDIRTFIQK